VLTGARFLQGVTGAAGTVLARAVLTDRFHGPELPRYFAVLSQIMGVAPIAAPVLGGAILSVSTWRAVFAALAVLGVLLVLAVLRSVPETLPPERRHGGGLRSFVTAGRQVLGHRNYVGYLVVAGSAMGALFAYVATSAFVLQSMNGLSPIAYSIDFAANAAGMTVAALVAARLAGRVATRKVILVGQVAALAAGVVMLVGALWFDTPLIVAIVCFFVLMSAQGLIGPNGGALASAAVPEHPGTGSAVLGFVQWVAAGVIAPIAGLGGEHTAVPMAAIMIVGALASMIGLLVIARASPAAVAEWSVSGP